MYLISSLIIAAEWLRKSMQTLENVEAPSTIFQSGLKVTATLKCRTRKAGPNVLVFTVNRNEALKFMLI